MENTTISGDVLDFPEQQKLPSTLNVLTILTFIWCALSLLLLLATPAIYNWSKGIMDKAATSGTEYNSQQLADMEKSRQAMEVAHQNMIPTIIVGLIGVVLCFVGALWMRKLKKDGFWMYVVGELLPVIVSIILLGKYQFTSWYSYLGLLIPIVFVALYAGQRKFLLK